MPPHAASAPFKEGHAGPPAALSIIYSAASNVFSALYPVKKRVQGAYKKINRIYIDINMMKFRVRWHRDGSPTADHRRTPSFCGRII
jgi:hypothetical protein